MNIVIVKNRDGEFGIGILENIEYLLSIRGLIRSFIYGRVKNLKVCIEYFEQNETIKKDLTEHVYGYLNDLTKLINKSLGTVESSISVRHGYIKNLLKDCDSFLIVKMHLILQTLLWLYIETKLPRLPKQYQNWSFAQIIDLADTFNEIPFRIISFCYSINEMRNNIAHKPMAFEFANIKQKYKIALYKKDGILFEIQNEQPNDREILEDWIDSFLIASIVLGYLISNNNPKDTLKKGEGSHLKY